MGGTVQRTRLWIDNWPEEHQLRIFCWAPDREKTKEALGSGLGRENVELIFTEGLGAAGRRLMYPGVQAIKQQLLEFQPDVLVSSLLWADVLSSFAARLLKLRGRYQVRHLVHVAAQPVPPDWQGTFVGRIYRQLVKSALASCSRVIVVSGAMRRDMISDGVIAAGKAVSVIPISVVVPEQSLQIRVDSEVVFGVVSRLDQTKGVDLLVRAIAELRGKGRAVRLDVWGDGPAGDELRQLISDLEVSKHVALHGWTDNPQVAFEKIHCLALASQSEGTPRSILLAGAYGIPTMACDVGGISDILVNNKTGWLVSDRKVSSLAKTMAGLADHPDKLAEAGQQAHLFVRNFSIESEISALFSAFEDSPSRNA